jgi:hypothetical protein
MYVQLVLRRKRPGTSYGTWRAFSGRGERQTYGPNRTVPRQSSVGTRPRNLVASHVDHEQRDRIALRSGLRHPLGQRIERCERLERRGVLADDGRLATAIPSPRLYYLERPGH